MKKYFYLLFFAFLFGSPLFSQSVNGGFTWDGLERTYRLYIPEGYEDGQSLPLVLNYHGYTSNAAQQELYSGMNAVADTGNFMVVYPQGVGDAWNVSWAFGSTADDVGFTSALIDTLHANYNINLDRVYSTGMSNGGFFSYKLACELNDRIAKIASVTGGMVDIEASQCMPENPISVMQIHGTSDPVVNYSGAFGLNIPTETLVSNWANHNGCALTPDTIYIEDIDPNDGATAELIQYRDCENNSMVAFFKIEGGGHTWPGSSLVIGVTNQDFNASSEIWNFFNDHYPANQDQFVDIEILDIFEQKLFTYPNPFQGNFSIESSVENIQSIRVFNALGQVLMDKDEIDSKIFKVNNIDWDSGIYFVQVKTEKGIQIIKLIKK